MTMTDTHDTGTQYSTQPGVDQPLDAMLMLADGACFYGRGSLNPAGRFGPQTIATGELVFTTAMTGYQEALTDPSYRGQMLMFTYPLIGNYGVAPGRAQSAGPQPSAAIVATLSPSSPQQASLAAYLAHHRVPTMHQVDTRALALYIRRQGAMSGILSVHRRGEAPSLPVLHGLLQACSYETRDFVAEISVTAPEVHGGGARHIALLDCGNKRSVIEELVRRDAQVTVLPARTSPSEILSLSPQGLVVSNGPGNPAAVTPVIETVRALYGRLPIFGICLGHQLLSLAAGGRTDKLKFGHRGANHPVQDCLTGRAFVTTQNHGYAVDDASLPPDLLVSHRNLNDGTVEGLRHTSLPIRSVQFHPEGAPGPRDAGFILDEWLELVA